MEPVLKRGDELVITREGSLPVGIGWIPGEGGWLSDPMPMPVMPDTRMRVGYCRRWPDQEMTPVTVVLSGRQYLTRLGPLMWVAEVIDG